MSVKVPVLRGERQTASHCVWTPNRLWVWCLIDSCHHPCLSRALNRLQLSFNPMIKHSFDPAESIFYISVLMIQQRPLNTFDNGQNAQVKHVREWVWEAQTKRKMQADFTCISDYSEEQRIDLKCLLNPYEQLKPGAPSQLHFNHSASAIHKSILSIIVSLHRPVLGISTRAGNKLRTLIMSHVRLKSSWFWGPQDGCCK